MDVLLRNSAWCLVVGLFVGCGGEAAGTDPAASDVGHDAGPLDSGAPPVRDAGPRDTGPWTPGTCPPRRIIASTLCDDPITGCVCDPTPAVCTPGWSCLGGQCFPPGQLAADVSAPDPARPTFLLDAGEGAPGIEVVNGPVGVRERDDGGWELELPPGATGTPVATLAVSASLPTPLRSGDVAEVRVCRDRRGGVTLQLVTGGQILLLATSDVAYVNDADCWPPDLRAEFYDSNCPFVPLGDDPDTTCDACRAMQLKFARGGAEVHAGRVGFVRIAARRFGVLASPEVRACTRTCCDVPGQPPETPRMDYVLVAVP